MNASKDAVTTLARCLGYPVPPPPPPECGVYYRWGRRTDDNYDLDRDMEEEAAEASLRG